jgi:quinol monooxygenase YgiN
MTKYGLQGKLMAMQGQGEELAEILSQASKLMAKAKGCHLYIVSKDLANEDHIWITEVWDSKEDHDSSLQLPGVGELISKAIPMLDGKPEKGIELEVISGV